MGARAEQSRQMPCNETQILRTIEAAEIREHVVEICFADHVQIFEGHLLQGDAVPEIMVLNFRADLIDHSI